MAGKVDYEKAIVMYEEMKMTRSQIAEFFNVHVSSINEGFRKRGITDDLHKGYITTWNGYIKIKNPTHPRADAKGYVCRAHAGC
jgi:flagellar basal body rod protein FlgC